MGKDEYLNQQERLLGGRIQFLRIRKGYNTQAEFSKVFTESNNKSSIVSRLEKGVNVQFKTIVRLAIVFKIRLIVLFDFNDRSPIIEFESTLSLEARIKEELLKVGKKIQDIRKHKNLLQLDLDIALNIDRANLSHYENGEEPLEFDTIAQIAFGLGVEVWELFDYN